MFSLFLPLLLRPEFGEPSSSKCWKGISALRPGLKKSPSLGRPCQDGVLWASKDPSLWDHQRSGWAEARWAPMAGQEGVCFPGEVLV